MENVIKSHIQSNFNVCSGISYASKTRIAECVCRDLWAAGGIYTDKKQRIFVLVSSSAPKPRCSSGSALLTQIEKCKQWWMVQHFARKRVKVLQTDHMALPATLDLF